MKSERKFLTLIGERDLEFGDHHKKAEEVTLEDQIPLWSFSLLVFAWQRNLLIYLQIRLLT